MTAFSTSRKKLEFVFGTTRWIHTIVNVLCRLSKKKRTVRDLSLYLQNPSEAFLNNCAFIFLDAETVVPEDNEPQLLPATPNKSETVYQPLPSPRVPKPSSTFKTPMPPPAVPAIPPAAQQTASQSSHNRVATAVASPDRNDEIGEGDSFPHVYSSPTAQTPVTTTNEVPSRRSKAVLTESTSQNGRTYRRQQNSLRYTHQPLPSENKENNPIIDVDTRISDRFMRVLRVSTSSRPQQRPLFEVAEDGLNSCLYSPPDSPQIDNDCTPNRPFTRLSSSLVEFDGNESLRFMLDEKRRLQDKLDYLKVGVRF